MDTLEEAYGEVGRAILFYPTEEILVFLYTDQQFFDVTRAPAWAGGLFDGKIRIPTKGSETQINRLRVILFHEYVHAAIHQMTRQGGQQAAVPTWLHEGVAQYFESSGRRGGRPVEDSMKAWIKQGGITGIIPLSQLHGSFMGANHPDAARLIYDESLSAVHFW